MKNTFDQDFSLSLNLTFRNLLHTFLYSLRKNFIKFFGITFVCLTFIFLIEIGIALAFGFDGVQFLSVAESPRHLFSVLLTYLLYIGWAYSSSLIAFGVMQGLCGRPFVIREGLKALEKNPLSLALLPFFYLLFSGFVLFSVMFAIMPFAPETDSTILLDCISSLIFFILFASLFSALPVCMLEKLSAISSMHRSASLMASRKIWGMLLIVVILIGLLEMLIAEVEQALQGDAELYFILFAVFIRLFIGCFLLPILMTVVYFHALYMREGKTPVQIADQLLQNPPPSVEIVKS